MISRVLIMLATLAICCPNSARAGLFGDLLNSTKEEAASSVRQAGREATEEVKGSVRESIKGGVSSAWEGVKGLFSGVESSSAENRNGIAEAPSESRLEQSQKLVKAGDVVFPPEPNYVDNLTQAGWLYLGKFKRSNKLHKIFLHPKDVFKKDDGTLLSKVMIQAAGPQGYALPVPREYNGEWLPDRGDVTYEVNCSKNSFKEISTTFFYTRAYTANAGTYLVDGNTHSIPKTSVIGLVSQEICTWADVQSVPKKNLSVKTKKINLSDDN